jgi:cyclopropane fatty-acyl-phospholipid synthase-like methyltransferase
LRLALKWAFFPGLNIGTRKRIKLGRHFGRGALLTLDAGCGNGAFSYLAYSRGNTVLGINSDAEQVLKCEAYRDFLGLDPNRCQFRIHNIYDVSTLDQKFDQIICFETLEHLKRDREVLTLFQGVLADNGVLHLCTPRRNRRPYYGEALSEDEDGGHVRLGYELAHLEDLLNGTGFVVTETDRAVGYFSLQVEAMLNMIDVKLAKHLRDDFRAVLRMLSFVCLYPLTFLDVLSRDYLCVYVQAKSCQAKN